MFLFMIYINKAKIEIINSLLEKKSYKPTKKTINSWKQIVIKQPIETYKL